MGYQCNTCGGGGCGYNDSNYTAAGTLFDVEGPQDSYSGQGYDAHKPEDSYSANEDYVTLDEEDEHKKEEEEKKESIHDKFEPEKDYKKEDALEEDQIKVKAATEIFHENRHVEKHSITLQTSKKSTSKNIEDAIKKAAEQIEFY